MSEVVTLTFTEPPVYFDHDLAAEVLISTLDAYSRAEIAARLTPSRETHLAETRASNVLFDVCLQLGMPLDVQNIAQWASRQAYGVQVAA